MEQRFDVLLSLFTGVIFALFGNDPRNLSLLKFLLILMVFDVIIGTISSLYKGDKFDYRKLCRGLVLKVAMLSAISFGYFVDLFDYLQLDVSGQSFFSGVFITTETLSNVSNFKNFGFDLSPFEKIFKL